MHTRFHNGARLSMLEIFREYGAYVCMCELGGGVGDEKNLLRANFLLVD